MFNLTLNLGYNITKRISAGLNVDFIGFSFGKKQNGVYYANNFATGVPVTAKPTSVNLFLISDNDKGSLNSEFFIRYKWNDSWNVKLAFQFLFAEYTTAAKVQTTPGGDKNDRFRKKMAGAAVGVAYSFKSFKKEKL
jgi:long-subunit fatty acid transport protein